MKTEKEALEAAVQLKDKELTDLTSQNKDLTSKNKDLTSQLTNVHEKHGKAHFCLV